MIHSWAFVFLLSSFSLEGGCHQTSQLLLKRELYWFLCYLCRREKFGLDHSGDDGAWGGGSGL